MKNLPPLLSTIKKALPAWDILPFGGSSLQFHETCQLLSPLEIQTCDITNPELIKSLMKHKINAV